MAGIVMLNKCGSNRGFKQFESFVVVGGDRTQKRVRETLAKLQGGGKKSSVKNRKEKRLAHKEVAEQEGQQKEASNK